ncbi:uncharacterized protein LOC129667197 [Psammomys obesus]|uniref:uncharacterized protein LOC129667197 n=1 Tax=Psammomys obesus TaxID=48139 RepID=UPI0024535961|nr:uncharacterized protein LOC129667197 [Psammomys obesus]
MASCPHRPRAGVPAGGRRAGERSRGPPDPQHRDISPELRGAPQRSHDPRPRLPSAAGGAPLSGPPGAHSRHLGPGVRGSGGDTVALCSSTRKGLPELGPGALPPPPPPRRERPPPRTHKLGSPPPRPGWATPAAAQAGPALRLQPQPLRSWGRSRLCPRSPRRPRVHPSLGQGPLQTLGGGSPARASGPRAPVGTPSPRPRPLPEPRGSASPPAGKGWALGVATA